MKGIVTLVRVSECAVSATALYHELKVEDNAIRLHCIPSVSAVEVGGDGGCCPSPVKGIVH